MLILCQEHGPPNGRKYNYVAEAKPVGYPETAVLCTRGNDYWCEDPGRVYLHEEEYQEFQNGQRVFGAPGRGTKIKVSDEARLLK